MNEVRELMRLLLYQLYIFQIYNENKTIAPCECKSLMSLLHDTFLEEVAHPYLFPTGKLGYGEQQNINLTPFKYLNLTIYFLRILFTNK